MDKLPLSIVMITLNEEANLPGALESVKDIAREVFIVDSYSTDRTVDIALEFGAYIVQRRFTNFGDHWNWTLQNMPIQTKWTFLLAPDERISQGLADELRHILSAESDYDGYTVRWRLWFMGKPLNVVTPVLRLWKTGKGRISDVVVNEHPVVDGSVGNLKGILEHHDSPDLHHWYEKQNRYSTMEAAMRFDRAQLAASPRLFGNALERRMWLKKIYSHVPFRHQLMFLYCLFGRGAWRAGQAGIIWSRLRAEVYRMREYKYLEMQMLQKSYAPPPQLRGQPDPRVRQFDEVKKGAQDSP